MAVDAYMYFQDYQSNYLASESQVSASSGTGDAMWGDYNFKAALGAGGIFEVEDYSFDVEQTLNIGSQSSGAGAGKITFNPFSITRKVDKASPLLFNMSCSGKSFQAVALGLKKSSGTAATGQLFVVFRFSLVAVKTLAWAHDDESPKETVTFEYGAFQIFYRQQDANGGFTKGTIGQGWDRVHNVSAPDKGLVIS